MEEKFSQVSTQELAKALKLDRSSIPKRDVEEVLKRAEAHRKNFTLQKVFQKLNARRDGRLDAQAFEDSLRATLSLDRHISRRIFGFFRRRGGSPSEPLCGSPQGTPLGSPLGPPHGALLVGGVRPVLSARFAPIRQAKYSGAQRQPRVSLTRRSLSTPPTDGDSICENDFVFALTGSH